MAAIDDVNKQFIDPTDPNTLYEGAANPKKVIDIRGMVKYITWDLLRFQLPTDFKGLFNPVTRWGLRDQQSRIHMLTEQNNFMLQQICKAANIDLSAMP